MTEHTTHKSDAQILAEKIKDIRIAMLTTEDSNGELYSRPMGTMQAEFDGDLWFFTQASAPKVDEVEQSHQVNLAYAKPESDLFVSVSGSATLVRDRQKIKEFWNPVFKVWFPNGESDPDLALLKVHVTSAQYWDGPSNKVTQLIGLAKGLLTGDRNVGGKNETLNINSH